MRGRPVSQVEIEEAIQDEVDHLEALTNGGKSPRYPQDEDLIGYDAICEMAAEAEAEWKIREARSIVAMANDGTKEAEYVRKARVLTLHAEDFRSHKRTAAVKESTKEALTTSRARLDALRTIAANVRSQV